MVIFTPNKPRKRPIATSLTKGEVTKKEKVTPRGIPPFTKPINKGTEEHEQNGVTTPNKEAVKYSRPYSFLRDR